MTKAFLICIIVALVLVCLLTMTVNKLQKIKNEKDELKKQNQGMTNAQKKKQKIHNGDNKSNFDNSIDILSDIAKKQ